MDEVVDKVDDEELDEESVAHSFNMRDCSNIGGGGLPLFPPGDNIMMLMVIIMMIMMMLMVMIMMMLTVKTYLRKKRQ